MRELSSGLEGWGDLDESVADVDEIGLGLALGLRSVAVLVLNARNLVQLLEDQPLLVALTIHHHVLLQPHEAEPQPLSDDLGGGLEQGGGLLEIALALLQAQLDVGAHPVGPQFLKKLGHYGIIAMIERIGEEDGVGDVAVVMRVSLNLPEGQQFRPVVDVGQRLEDLRI